MSYVNSRGQMIQELEETDEMYQFGKRMREMHLKYPRDRKLINRLPRAHFNCWLYGLDPKEALFLSNDPTFRNIQDRQQNKGYFGHLADLFWRIWHGYHLEVR